MPTIVVGNCCCGSSSSSSSSGSSSSQASSSGGGGCGCAGVPNTLYATITASVNCACAVGTTIAIMFNGTAWVGSGTFGTCGMRAIELSFTCNLSAPTNPYLLTVSFSDGCAPITEWVGAYSCSPFQWASAIANAGFGNCGCDGPPPSALNLVITT